MSRTEIDAAIARHADTELLYDRPYEDKKKVRVAGPFTVESLSPHRSVSFEQAGEGTKTGTEQAAEADPQARRSSRRSWTTSPRRASRTAAARSGWSSRGSARTPAPDPAGADECRPGDG